MQEARTRPGGRIVWVRDATANDSDKSFTVPAGKLWEPISIWVEITCTATVGNRVLIVRFTDGTNTIYVSQVSGAITATQRGILFACFGGGGPRSTTAGRFLTDGNGPNIEVDMWDGRVYLPAGYVIRAMDNGVIDATADDMTVLLHYIEYDV